MSNFWGAVHKKEGLFYYLKFADSKNMIIFAMSTYDLRVRGAPNGAFFVPYFQRYFTPYYCCNGNSNHP